MKYSILIATLVFIFCIDACFASDDYFYVNGQQVHLHRLPNEIAVMPDTRLFNNWTDIYDSFGFLVIEQQPEYVPSIGFYILRLNGSIENDIAIADMRLDNRLMFVNPIYIDDKNRKIFVGNHIYVKLKPEHEIEFDSLIALYNLNKIRNAFHNPLAFSLQLEDGRFYNPVYIANRIYEAGIAMRTAPSFVLPLTHFGIPNDIDFPAQYHLDTLDMPLIWDLTIPNPQLLIAMIDEGVESHEDIDSNCWADGYDYLFDNDDESPPDTCEYCYHAMAVTGIIAATENNDSLGIAGMAGRDGIRILGQEVYFEQRGSRPIFADTWKITNAIEDAVDSGAAIINICFGYLCSDFPRCCEYDDINEGLEYADSMGVLVICASGNACGDTSFYCNPPAYPACHWSTVAVGAIAQNNQRMDYSMYGSELDVVSYAENIPTTDRMGTNGASPIPKNSKLEDPCEADDNYYCSFGGTSAAAPQVTAIAALIMQKRTDFIGKTDTLKRIIRYSCQNPSNPDAEDTARINDYVGWGRVNAFRALLAVSRGDANNDGSVNIADEIRVYNYVFKSGPAPEPHPLMGDANCDGTVDVGDDVYLMNYIFHGGPPPPEMCFEY